MNARGRLAVGWLAVSLLHASAAAAQPEVLEVELTAGARLRLSLPAEWKATVEPGDGGTTVLLSPRGEGDFRVLLTLLPMTPDSPGRSPELLQVLVEAAGTAQLASATQTELELVEIAGEGVHGWLYHLTDRQPERGPGDYREAHQGMLRIGDHLASVTILTHSEDTATVERAKQVLASAVPSPPPSGRR